MHMSANALKKRKVCVFCQTWESGGIEAFLHNILLEMDLSLFEVDIVVEKLGGSIFTESLREAGIRFYELSGSTRQMILNYRKFSELLAYRKYDVLHLNVFQAQAMMYLKVAEQQGIPIRIAHSHNTMLRSSTTRPLKMWIHWISKYMYTKRATDWWACSKMAAEFMFPKEIIQKKLYRFIPNGINLEKYKFDNKVRQEIRKSLKIENGFVIGHVGRLCYQKNQTFLLKVFAKVQKAIPTAQLLLVGDGDDLPKLQQLANELGIVNNVIFYGVNEHVERLLWAMDAFAFPSRFEGLGIAVIEAQASGLPVVCSNQIPEEAIITSHSLQLPLTNQSVWYETLIAMDGWPRTGLLEKDGISGFDVKRVGEQVEREYLY